MLERLFKPQSIAVIGASRDSEKVGHAVLRNLLDGGFQGRLYPVNPQAEEILGLRCYRSLSDIKEVPEQIVVAVPAHSAVAVVKEAAKLGVGSAVILSAGFREAGPEGLRLEDELKEIVRESGIRIIGPNCLGIINTGNNLNATFAKGTIPKGRVSFFSQSGALGIAILDWAIGNWWRWIGFSKFVSLGNKVDLNEIDFLEYFMDDPETDLILGYIEDVTDGRRFLEIARRATKIKPVILIKSGGTGAGARAASSHTGALAGSEVAFNSAFRQTGIIRAGGIEELFDLTLAFSGKRLPHGKRLLIVTNAGGPGILAADTAEREGLELPLLGKELIQELRKILPGNASLYNPIDIIGDADAERYRAVLERAINDNGIDGIVVILTPQAITDVDKVADIVVEVHRRCTKPIIACFMGEASTRKAIEFMKSEGIPSFSFPEKAVQAFKRLWDYYKWKTSLSGKVTGGEMEVEDIQKEKAEALIRSFIMNERFELTDGDAMEILSCYGFRGPRSGLARSSEEAVRIAKEIGFPVVMKISSPDILHKTEVGGVRLNISSEAEVREAFIEMTSNVRRLLPSAFIEGVRVYEMIKGGKELIVGITQDRTFGPMIMVGLGGIYVEIMKDVSFRIAPLSREDALSMIEELKAYPLLKGVRGERPVDIDAVVNSLVRLSRFVIDFPHVIELDINPLVVLERGALCLDARIILSKELNVRRHL